MELLPDVHLVRGTFGCNVYLLVGERLALVDAGLPGNADAIARYVRRLGRSAEEIDLVVLTHYHPDHIGSVPELHRRYGCAVAIHALEAPYLEGSLQATELRTWGAVGRMLSVAHRVVPWQGVPVALPLVEGTQLNVLGGATVLHTPGHTAGSLCLHVPGRRLLFTGDSVVCKWPRRLSLAGFPVTADLDEAYRSLSRLARMDVGLLFPGHGRPLAGNAGQALRQFLAAATRSRQDPGGP
ncbi:MAG: MBL fold metallo-hydrolase [Chloroflexota bacterium]